MKVWNVLYKASVGWAMTSALLPGLHSGTSGPHRGSALIQAWGRRSLGQWSREEGKNDQCHSSLEKTETVQDPSSKPLLCLHLQGRNNCVLICNVCHRHVCKRLGPQLVELLRKLLKTLSGCPQLEKLGHQVVLGVSCPWILPGSSLLPVVMRVPSTCCCHEVEQP